MSGCPQEGDEIIVLTADSDFPSKFPDFTAHAQAADGRAYSEALDAVDDWRYFNDHGNSGRGIFIHETRPFDGEGNGVVLWASYFDNGRFSPKVELFGQRQDDESSIDLSSISVVYLNGVAGRDGDAVITYRRRSIGDPTARNEDNLEVDGANIRLYSGYFDHSQRNRGEASADDGADLRYGFTT